MVHQYIPNLKKYRAIAFDIGDKDVVVDEGEDVMLQASRDMDQILRDYGIEHTLRFTTEIIRIEFRHEWKQR